MRSDHLTRWFVIAPRNRAQIRPLDRHKPGGKTMSAYIGAFTRCLAACAFALSFSAFAQSTITLHGAVQFNDDHAFTRALVKFEELVKKYYGKPINFVLHKNSELGLEKD